MAPLLHKAGETWGAVIPGNGSITTSTSTSDLLRVMISENCCDGIGDELKLEIKFRKRETQSAWLT